jgi:holo-[acyl-carrier protein] synthase
VIIGIGNDIVDIRRIRDSIDRFGDRFIQRIYTEVEQARAERKAGRVATYAKRFAAKEACSKALGTGMNKGVAWRGMGVVNQPGGRPTMELTGGALERLKALTPPGHTAIIHLTITDEEPYAQAYVIIEARPDVALPR